jgi:hypothetical protein
MAAATAIAGLAQLDEINARRAPARHRSSH